MNFSHRGHPDRGWRSSFSAIEGRSPQSLAKVSCECTIRSSLRDYFVIDVIQPAFFIKCFAERARRDAPAASPGSEAAVGVVFAPPPDVPALDMNGVGVQSFTDVVR